MLPPWSFVVLPDTQIYTRKYGHLLHAQTEWIARERDARDIRFVLHAGDITDRNAPEEWAVARAAFAHLDGRVPYTFAAGNHDYGEGGSGADRTTGLDDWFSFDEQSASARVLHAFEPRKLGNTVRVYDTPHGPWLVIALEFGPRPAAVAWARETVAQHRGTPAVLVTHAYLYDDGTRYDHATRGTSQSWSVRSYGVSRAGALDGEELWSEWLVHQPEVEMVVCGHVLGRGVAHLESRRADGSVAHQLLANYQHTRLGGSAYLRVVTVHPDRFEVGTYSPHLDRWMTDSDNELTLARR